MCGIVGYIGELDCAPILLAGLQRLEYRGYDSAGIAVWDRGETKVIRSLGKLARLEALLKTAPPAGRLGIGHTRWATHGRPSTENAHPHKVGGVAVVHNGIIENHVALRAGLAALGRRFSSETDTEIFAHLIDLELASCGGVLVDAVRAALARVRGSFAVAVISDAHPDELVVARNGSPLVIGLGAGEQVVASDVAAILARTRRVLFLEDGDVASVSRSGVSVTNAGEAVVRAPRDVLWSPLQAEKGGYKHFMLKEIHEQPRAVADTLSGRLDLAGSTTLLDGLDPSPSSIARIVIVACGTSYHAAAVGKFLLEGLARIPVEVDLASEFRTRDPIIDEGDLLIAISQSGETADTLGAVKEAKARGARVLAITNGMESSIVRAADWTFYTRAGPEIGVASTKAFTTQLVALVLIAIHLGRKTGALTAPRAAALLEALLVLPAKMQEILDEGGQLQALARRYRGATGFLFLGRGAQHPIAMEGALKLKEISYIHAEGYAAGEMKHGPIALIDASLPVVVLAPAGPLYARTVSNLSEVRAREGRVILIATRGDADAAALADDVVFIPETAPELQAILTTIPLQLLAYHVADQNGTDVDQPRNLAKSVTVE